MDEITGSQIRRITAPSWETFESLIRSMNQSGCSQLSLEKAAVQRVFSLGGGYCEEAEAYQFACTVTRIDSREETHGVTMAKDFREYALAANAAASPVPDIEIIIDGVAIDLSADLIVPLPIALEAAREFFVSGEMTKQNRWVLLTAYP